jgi:hypothetical protein
MPNFFKSLRSPVVLLSIGMLLTTGIAVFFAFKYSVISERVIADTADTTKCGPCMGYNNAEPNESKLDLNLIKTMAFNYQNLLPSTEARSVWFNLDVLKKFIYQIESKSCNTCTGDLGIRIYYGRYPGVSGWSIFSDLSQLDTDVKLKSGGINNYGNLHTVFMVPTIMKSDGYNHDFNPGGPYGCDAYDAIKEYRKMSEDTLQPVPLYTTAAFGTQVMALMAQNHGDACPPPPSGKTCPQAGAFFNK